MILTQSLSEFQEVVPCGKSKCGASFMSGFGFAKHGLDVDTQLRQAYDFLEEYYHSEYR